MRGPIKYTFLLALVAVGCSEAPAGESSGSSTASGVSTAASGSGGATSSSGAQTSSSATGGGASTASTGAGGMGGTGPHYADAPDAPPRHPWQAPNIDPITKASPDDDWHAHDNAALIAFEQMYLPASGTFDAGYRWTFANGVEAVESSFTRTGGENQLYIVENTYDNQNYDQFLNDGGYDDQMWWAHAWIRAYELTGDTKYLESAKVIFNDTLSGWEPKVCGGGVWWQKGAVYKNAITNELFVLIAASLHNRVAGDSGAGSYLEWATKGWTWFSNSGMINADGLINDGLTDSCKNNKQTTWTYNQGVVLGALVEMYQATGDDTFLTQAEKLADASTAKLLDAKGILLEPCDAGMCNWDQVSFKGLYIRNLAKLYDWTHKASYYDFMVKNARSLWKNARDGENRIGSDWSGPFDSAGSTRQSSAMFAMSSLADQYSQASLFLRSSAGPSFIHDVGARAGLLEWACDAATCPSAGSMLGGPYVAYLPAGAHTLHVRAKVDHTSMADTSLAAIEVYDGTASSVLATRELAWKEALEANVVQDFTLDFVSTADHPLEFRVQWHAASGAPRFAISDLAIDGEQSFTATNLDHECGRLDGRWHWSADRFRDASACTMTRGPGVRLAHGPYVANFELKVDEFAIDNAAIATISVVNVEENKTIASAQIARGDFKNVLFTTFALPFQSYEGYHYEFLTQWLAAPLAPRLTERGVYLRRGTTETTLSLPFNTNDGSLDPALLGMKRDVHFHPFVFGMAGNNILNGGGDAVSVPTGKYQSLELLAFAVGGTQVDQVFTVTYDDASAQTTTRSISDWLAPAPEANESIAFNLPYRLDANNPVFGNYHVFHVSIPVDASKNLKGFQLPPNGNVNVVAATLSAPK
jgi:predicted alpha-1,6-mannanase (GH76 family)